MSFAAELWIPAIPAQPIRDPVAWCEKYVILPGSAKGSQFSVSKAPWLRLPLSLINDGVTRKITFVKPVQIGGSVLGEAALCYLLANSTGGDFQFNWETDEKAEDRWSKRIEKIFRATKPVFNRFPKDRHKIQKGLVVFPHCNFTIQGVASEGNLASDSIRYQFNEEIHGWPAGRLQLAGRRTTAFDNSFTLNISNASKSGDQLHQVYLEGTQEQWLVLCPGCGEHHQMRTRWDDKEPHLGGLRYDSEGCKNTDGTYDHNKLAPTIRYQMPCGHEVQDVLEVRQKMSAGGKWSAPNNPSAHIANRSFNLDAVCYDALRWRELIEEKHRAIRARNSDDPTLWIQYLNERECQFYDPEFKPWKKAVVLTKDLKKNREGLAGRMARYFALDRQLGIAAKGEEPHWWLVIRDYMANGDSQLIFEGKLHTSSEVIGVLDSHGCRRDHGVADSGADTDHVYAFCLKYGINAIKGGQTPTYKHSDGVTQVWSEPKPVFTMIAGAAPMYDYVDGRPDHREPYFWEYSKHNIRNLLAYLMDTTSFATPDDVSEDYTAHMNAMEKKVGRHSRTNEPFEYWEVSKGERRFDLRVCECYCAMLFKMSGKMGAGPKPIEEKPS